jgi:hypothetical protein
MSPLPREVFAVTDASTSASRSTTPARAHAAEDLKELADAALREIAADEAIARNAARVGKDPSWIWRDDRTGATLGKPAGEWLGDTDCEPSLYARPTAGSATYTQLLDAEGDVPAAVGAHIAHFDPARVLRECALKRRLVSLLLAGVEAADAARILRAMAGTRDEREFPQPAPESAATAGTFPDQPDPDWLPYPQRTFGLAG